MPQSGAKGFAAEEALRGYFRSVGYFVVRNIPLVYKDYDITDVDLWLYVKTTSLTAERTCVDVKFKRTPQVMERVLWIKGLKEILGVDRAIVVTTDNRHETRTFAGKHGIGILQGEFLRRVVTNFPPSDRLTEEDLFSLLLSPCIIKPKVDWRRWYQRSKTKLIDNLNFDGCNSFIQGSNFLFDEYLATDKSSEVAIRLLYLNLAYFLICLDFTSRSFIQFDTNVRSAILTDGFRYGEAGQQRTEEIVKMALNLISDAGIADIFTGDVLKNEFHKQMSEYNTEIMGEFFGKSDSLKNLFTLACNFEEQAFSKKLLRPSELPSEQKAIIGIICDLLGYDRKKII